MERLPLCSTSYATTRHAINNYPNFCSSQPARRLVIGQQIARRSPICFGTMHDAVDPVSDLRPCFDSTRECSRRSVLKAGVGAALALPAFPAGDTRTSTRRCSTEEHQITRQFCALECPGSMQKIGGWSQANRDRVADLLFFQTKEIGLSCWRLTSAGKSIPKSRIKCLQV